MSDLPSSRLDVLQSYSNYGSSHAHSSSGYVPHLITQMARDYGAIPATSAPSERVFSVAGNLIAKKRTKISSENVRYVLCLRSWGILVEADDEEEIIINDNGQIVEQE